MVVKLSGVIWMTVVRSCWRVCTWRIRPFENY